MAALEAMACCVPAIATNVGGVPELIDNGVTGLLYKVGDVDEMAAGALELLGDWAKLEEMRRAARRTAKKNFCANDIVKKYVEFYGTVLAQG